MTTTAAVVIALVLVVGAAAQRVTGLGFAIIAAPVLVLLVGPAPGVVLVNVLGAVVALLVLLRVHRDVELRRVLPLTGTALLGVPAGLALAQVVPPAWLELVLGALVLAALVVSARAAGSDPAEPAISGAAPAAVAGAGSGVLHAAAGLGSPALSVYAVLSGWPQRSFTASVQPWFVVVGLVAAVLEVTLQPAALLRLPWALWVGAVVAAAVGTALGELLLHRLSPAAARRGLLVLSLLGATTILLEGLVRLLAG